MRSLAFLASVGWVRSRSLGSNMTCFLCLEKCDLPSPCSLCQVRCHSACLGDYVTRCGVAGCPQCGVRLNKADIIEGFKALHGQCEAEFGAFHEKTLSARLDLAVAYANLGGHADEARALFEEVRLDSDSGWLQTACRLENARHLARTDPPEAVRQARQLLDEIGGLEEVPSTIVLQAVFALATAHFANGDQQEAKQRFQDGLCLLREDASMESRLPFLEGMAECCERENDLREATFYRQQVCRIVEHSPHDVCTVATARLEHALSMKKAELEIPRALRAKLKHSMRSLRQRRADKWCSELLPPASAAIFWLSGVKRRIRKKTRAEDLLAA